MRKIIKEANLQTFICWIVLILLFVAYPIYNVYSGNLTCFGESGDKPFWIYLVGLFIWDWFLIIGAATITLFIAIFGKIGQWVYDLKDKKD